MIARRFQAVAWYAVALVVGAAGCGGGGRSGEGALVHRSNVVDVYASLPLHGSSATRSRALLRAMRLALAQTGGRAGRFAVNFQALDDSTAAAGGYDATQTANNARKAAMDPRAVLYLGELSSQASEISIPITNQAGLAQVSPTSTYVGLTTHEAGSARNEPQRYFPTGRRTFLRIIPRDSVQAAADLLAVKQAGCTRLAVASDKTRNGRGLAQLLEVEKGLYGVTLVSNSAAQAGGAPLRTYATGLRALRADCFIFAGGLSVPAAQVTRQIHAALPRARIFGTDGICSSSWTDSRSGGVPAAIDPLIKCTLPILKLSAYPGGRSFAAAFRARYGVAVPDPYAIFGYDSMALGLSTIARLGPRGADKAAVVEQLFATSDRRSVLGTYGFDRSGDTTLRAYGLYRVGRRGAPVFFKALVVGRVR